MRRFAPYGLAAISMLLLLPFARIDFDRLHDGYMLAQAMAIDSGLRIHGEVAGQYGPVIAWIQSLALHLPVAPGLALRLETVCTICVTVFLLADIGRLRPSRSPVTYASGFMAAVAWMIVSDIWLGGPMRPWSSLAVTFLLVLAAYSALRGWYLAERGRILIARALFALSGCALGLTVFTRLSSGIVLMFAVAICGASLLWLSKLGRMLFLMAFVGLLVSALAIVGVLVMTDSATAFLQDTFVGPQEVYSADPMEFIKFLASVMPVYSPAVIVGIASLVLIGRARPPGLYSRSRALVALGSGVAMLAMTVFLARMAARSGPVPEYWTSWRALFFFYAWGMVTASVVAMYSVWLLASGRNRSSVVVAWLSLSVFAGASLSTVVPTFNGRHVWWSLPLALVLVFSMIHRVTRSSKLRETPLLLPMIIFGVYAAFTYVNNLQVARYQAPENSVASGMLVSREVFDTLRDDRDLLVRVIGNERAVFLTDTGDLSIIRGEYASADRFYTCWALLPDLASRLNTSPPVVVDETAEMCGESYSSNLLTDLGYVLKGRNERLSIYVR